MVVDEFCSRAIDWIVLVKTSRPIQKEHIMKYETIEEINKNPVWIKLQCNGTDKEELDKQFLSLTEDEKIVAIDLFESLKVVMENIFKENTSLDSRK